MRDQITSDGAVQALLDERDVVQVALRYCRALDTKNWALLDDVFVADATAELGSPAAPRRYRSDPRTNPDRAGTPRRQPAPGG